MKSYLGPALILVLAFYVLLLGVWSEGYPIGTDAWGHISKAEYLAERVQTKGITAYFKTSWMPQWYMGDAFRTYYPPLTTLILTPISFIFGDPATAHKVFASICLLIFALVTFLFLYITWGAWPAALGSVLAIWAPYQIRTLFFEGNYPRILSLISLPLIGICTERLLDWKQPRMPTVFILALSWAWAILAHPQQALIFAFGFLIYVIFRLFIDPDVPLKWLGWCMLGVVMGGLLTAPWSLPAYSHLESSQVPYLPYEKVGLFSAPLNAILPTVDVSDGQVQFGFGVLVLALLCAAARPDKRRTSYVWAGLITIWLSLGPKAVLFNLLPLSSQLLPERFLNFSVFALAIGASGLLPIKYSPRLGRLIVLAGFVFIDIYPSVEMLPGRPYPSAQALLDSVRCQSEGGDCRVALLTYPEPTALEVYFSSQRSNLTTGWALENTPHHRAVRRVLSAPEWSYAYLEHLFSLWNVGAVVLRGETTSGKQAEAALQKMEFYNEHSLGDYEIWQRDAAMGSLQWIPARRMLLIGDKLTPFLMSYPFAEESTEQLLSHYPRETLRHYTALGLFMFEHDQGKLRGDEEKLLSYLEGGGRAILELSGMEEVFGRALDFLGVSVLRLSFNEPIEIRWAEPLEKLPLSLPLDLVAPEGWNGAVYQGLDGVVGEVAFGGEWYPFLGYKDFGNGRAWFVGLNLLHYAQLSGKEDVVEAIRRLTLQDVQISENIVLPRLSYTDYQMDGQSLSLVYETDQRIEEALVSFTYSPRWQVFVDAEEVPFSSYENLIKVGLPAGNHELSIQYKLFSSPWSLLGLGLGSIVFMGLILAGWLERRRFIPIPDTELEVREPMQGSYAPCANCGFLLATVGEPTAITYPFQVVDCPICGLHMDDEGFQPGAELSQADRIQRLADWLQAYDYDPTIVHTRWGFKPEDFFGATEKDAPHIPLDQGIEGINVE